MKNRYSAMFASLVVSAVTGCGAHDQTPALSAREHDALAASSPSGEQAAAHRVAAQSIRYAEDVACAGISTDERNAGPLAVDSKQIVSVEPLILPVAIGKQTYLREEGSKVTIVAAPGLTAQWLTRLAECHIARHASEGPEIDEGRPCPFAVGAVAVNVVEAPTSFVLSLRADGNAANAERVLRVSEALHTGVNIAFATPDTRSAPRGPAL
jgi:hypothetical protein